MLKVFIADDSDWVRERLVSMLLDLEMVEIVGEARDVQTALALLKTIELDVAIIDVRMPGGTGLQILKALKAGENPPVVIMLTAFPYPAHRQYCLEAGAEFFFDKADGFDSVVAVLKDFQASSVKARGA